MQSTISLDDFYLFTYCSLPEALDNNVFETKDIGTKIIQIHHSEI